MKVLILGGEGMLGHSLFANLEANFEVKALVKSKEKALLVNKNFNPKDLFEGVNLEKEKEIEELIFDYSPDVVLNAIGLIKQKNVENLVISSIKLNSLLPHILLQLSLKLDFKLICFSTDCVFSGKKGFYNEADTPDPVDLYGYTKFLGEQIKQGLVLRTSFIGLELESKYGIIEWYLNQDSEISGYSNAIYSGLLTAEVSRLIEKILKEHLSLSGLWNVSSDPINKFELLSCLNKLLGNRIPIKSLEKPKIDRSLDSSKFRKQINYCPPSWDESLEELAEEIKLRESK